MEGDEGICRERDCVLHGGWPVDVDRWMLRGYAPIRLGAAGCGVSSGKRVDLSNFVVWSETKNLQPREQLPSVRGERLPVRSLARLRRAVGPRSVRGEAPVADVAGAGDECGGAGGAARRTRLRREVIEHHADPILLRKRDARGGGKERRPEAVAVRVAWVALAPEPCTSSGWCTDICPGDSATCSAASPSAAATCACGIVGAHRHARLSRSERSSLAVGHFGLACCPRRSIEESEGERWCGSWPLAWEPRTTVMQPCCADASERATQHVTAPSGGSSPQ